MPEEKQYIEILFRIEKKDYEELPDDETEKMWNDSDNISTLEIKGQILALGVDGFISKYLE